MEGLILDKHCTKGYLAYYKEGEDDFVFDFMSLMVSLRMQRGCHYKCGAGKDVPIGKI